MVVCNHNNDDDDVHIYGTKFLLETNMVNNREKENERPGIP